MQQLIAGIPPIILWSALIHVLITLIILGLRHLLRNFVNSRTSRYRTINEFLFSIGWVMLTLEDAILFNVGSEVSGVTALGLRLFVSPMLFHKVFGNPCEVLYYYLLRSPRLRKSTNLLGNALLAEMLAIPAGIGLSLLMWKTLSYANYDYTGFVEKKMDASLSVPPHIGLLIEALISFLMFMPGLFFPASLMYSLFETCFIVGLVYHFGAFTGAFMNPMAAASCLLMWHSQSLAQMYDVGIHLGVYLLGPVLGTLGAVVVAKLRYGQSTEY